MPSGPLSSRLPKYRRATSPWPHWERSRRPRARPRSASTSRTYWVPGPHRRPVPGESGQSRAGPPWRRRSTPATPLGTEAVARPAITEHRPPYGVRLTLGWRGGCRLQPQSSDVQLDTVVTRIGTVRLSVGASARMSGRRPLTMEPGALGGDGACGEGAESQKRSRNQSHESSHYDLCLFLYSFPHFVS